MVAKERRTGLVLGGGGVVAQAFHAGVLTAMLDVTGWDARSAATIVGTSAGASTSALVRAGLDGADLVRRACGEAPTARVAPLLARMGAPLDITELRSRTSRRVGRRPAAPQLLLRAMSHPFDPRPGLLAAGLLPEGHIPWSVIAEPIERVFPDGWPAEPLWVCAARLDDGARVVFGRSADGGPEVSVGTAVAASCAVPGFYAPVEVAGRRYVDGGVWSATNADVLATEPLDTVVVISPMTVRPGRRWTRDAPMRMLIRRHLDAELATLRRAGITAVVIEPTADDARVLGTDAFDTSRREPATRHVLASATERIRDGDLHDAFAGAGLAG